MNSGEIRALQLTGILVMYVSFLFGGAWVWFGVLSVVVVAAAQEYAYRISKRKNQWNEDQL